MASVQSPAPASPSLDQPPPSREGATSSSAGSSSSVLTSAPISSSASYPGGLGRPSSSSAAAVASTSTGHEARPRRSSAGPEPAPYPSSTVEQPAAMEGAYEKSPSEELKPSLPFSQPRYSGAVRPDREREESPTDSAVDELDDGPSGELSPASSGGGAHHALAIDSTGSGPLSAPTYLPKTTSTLASLGGGASGRTQATFVRKLFTMIEDLPESTPTNPKPVLPLICWSRNGETFVVHNLTEFSGSILPQYFKHNNWQSFVRQLNMYGFHKVNDVLSGGSPTVETSSGQAWEFQHPNFRRGRPDLFQHIKRKTAKQGGLASMTPAPPSGPVAGPSASALPQSAGPAPPPGPSELPHQYPLQPVVSPFYHPPPPPPSHGMPFAGPYMVAHHPHAHAHAHMHHPGLPLARPPPLHGMPLPPGGPPPGPPHHDGRRDTGLHLAGPPPPDRRPSGDDPMLPPPTSRAGRPTSSGGRSTAATTATLPPPRRPETPGAADEVKGRPPPGTAQPRMPDFHATSGTRSPYSSQTRPTAHEWSHEVERERPGPPQRGSSNENGFAIAPVHGMGRQAPGSAEPTLEAVNRRLDGLTEQLYRTSQDTLAGKQNTVIVLKTILNLVSGIIDDPAKALAEIEAGREKMREDVTMAQDVIAKLEQQNRAEADGLARPPTALSTSSMPSPMGYVPMHASGRPTSRGLPAHGTPAPAAEHSPGSVSVASLHPSATNSPRPNAQPYPQPHFAHSHAAPSRTFPGPPPLPPPNASSASIRRGDWGPAFPTSTGPSPMNVGAWLPPRPPLDNKRPYSSSKEDDGRPAVEGGRRSPSMGPNSSGSSSRETPRSAMPSSGGLSLPPLSSLLRGSGQTRPLESDERDSKRMRY